MIFARDSIYAIARIC